MAKKIGKYRVLVDYGPYEGMKFWDEKRFETVNEAVKFAISLNLSTPFLIVEVMEWEANIKVKSK